MKKCKYKGCESYLSSHSASFSDYCWIHRRKLIDEEYENSLKSGDLLTIKQYYTERKLVFIVDNIDICKKAFKTNDFYLLKRYIVKFLKDNGYKNSFNKRLMFQRMKATYKEFRNDIERQIRTQKDKEVFFKEVLYLKQNGFRYPQSSE